MFKEAARDGDLQGQRESLYQAGIAPYSDDYTAQAIRMLGALPLQDRGPEAMVASEVYRKLAWGDLPNIAPAVSYCKAPADQPDRRALGARAAAVHARQARTLLDLALAKGLAKEGGDVALDEALKNELDQLRNAMQDSSAPLMELLARGEGCAAGAIMYKQMYEVASGGELAWARARLAASATAR